MSSKKVCVSVIVMATMLEVCSGATAIGLSAYNKDYKNQCVDDETGSTHRLHSSWQMKKECGQKTCVKYSNLLYIQYETCGLINFQAGADCKIVKEISRPFPDCCPKIVCEPTETVDSDNDNINNEINIDEFFHYDENISENSPDIYEDYFLSGDEISEQQHPNESHEPVEYMIDWDTLFPGYN